MHPIDTLLGTFFPSDVAEQILQYEPCILEYEIVDEIVWTNFVKSHQPIPQGVIRCVFESYVIMENYKCFSMYQFNPLEMEFALLFKFCEDGSVEEILCHHGLFLLVIQKKDASFEIQTRDKGGILLTTLSLRSPFPDPSVLLTHLYPFHVGDHLHYAFVQFHNHRRRKQEDAFLGVSKHLAENLLFFTGDKADFIHTLLQKPVRDQWLSRSEEKKVYLLPGTTTEKIIKSIGHVACFNWNGNKAPSLTRMFIRQRFSYVLPHYPCMLYIVSVFFHDKAPVAWAHEGSARPFMILSSG